MKRYVGPVSITLALLFSLVALVLSSITLVGALRFRQALSTAVGQARDGLDGLDSYSLQTSIPLSQTFPIQADVPLQQDFVVPIRTEIPLSTVVQVPLQIPVLGTYEVSVPVEARIPVNIQVVIPVSETLRVETVVTVDTQFPLRLDAAQLGLGNLLAQLDAALAEIEQGLR